MSALDTLAQSRGLWNRKGLDLGSNEVLAQILDRGDMNDWRALYALATQDATLRARLHEVVRTVPLPLPAFWLAALAALGESVDYDAPLPQSIDL